MTSISHTGSRLLSLMFFLIGLGALGLTISGNYWFGQSLANDPTLQMWQGGVAVYIDAMVATLAFACGWLMTRGRWVSGLSVGLFALVFAAMSIYSLVGLGATERIAKSRTLSAQIKEQSDISRSSATSIAGAHERNLSWLRSQSTNPRVPAAERKLLRADLFTQTRAGPQVSVASPETIMSDPQAEIMAELTGAPVDQIQMLSIGCMAILLITGKMLAFWLSGLVSRVHFSGSLPLSNLSNEINGEKLNGGPLTPVDNLGNVEDFSRPLSIVENAPHNAPRDASQYSTGEVPESDVEEREREIVRLRGAIHPEAERHVFDLRIIHQFLADCTRPEAGSRIAATALWQAYASYAEAHGYVVASQNQFGRLCTTLRLPRVSGRRSLEYINLRLVRGIEAGEAPHARAA